MTEYIDIALSDLVFLFASLMQRFRSSAFKHERFLGCIVIKRIPQGLPCKGDLGISITAVKPRGGGCQVS